MAGNDINKTCKALIDAYASGDLDALMECYTDDCRFVGQGSGIITGRENVKKEFETLMKTHDKIDFVHEDRTVAGNNPGDLACEAGKASVHEKGKEEWDHGVYVTTFMKGEDGKWRIRYDCTIFG